MISCMAKPPQPRVAASEDQPESKASARSAPTSSASTGWVIRGSDAWDTGLGVRVLAHPPAQIPLTHETLDASQWRFDVASAPRLPHPQRSVLLSQAQRNIALTRWLRFVYTWHRVLHYAFAEEYLRSLDKLPVEDPLNEQSLRVDVGIVAMQATGEIAELYLRRSSGNAEFDAAALSAFLRIIPVPVPVEAASTDGRAYFVWELYRRPSAASIPIAHVYRFIDDTGRVIYVGKAKSLRSRVNSYFADLTALHPRTQAMVTSASRVQ